MFRFRFIKARLNRFNATLDRAPGGPLNWDVVGDIEWLVCRVEQLEACLNDLYRFDPNEDRKQKVTKALETDPSNKE